MATHHRQPGTIGGPGRQGGFTLIEALIAIFVFTVGILATVSMQISSLEGNNLARSNTEAAAVAASVVEELRALTHEHPLLQPGSRDLAPVGRYTVSYAVTDEHLVRNTKNIAVTVGLADGGNQRSVEIHYLLATLI